MVRYWVREAVKARPLRGDEVEACCWGWSEQSEEEARQRARASAERVARRIAAGDGFPDRYGYGDGRPLREEIVESVAGNDGTPVALITRNAYGALVLNTSQTLFIDVDLEETKTAATAGEGGLAGLIGRFFGSKPAPAPAATNDTPETAAIERARNWVRANPGLGFRVYRTAAGLRLLETTSLHDPKSASVASLFEAFGTDPLYRRLCRAQECFRARLTPKPWRVRVSCPGFRYPAHNSTQPGVRMWLNQYEKASAQTAVCALVTTLGSQEIHPEVAGIIRLHDERTRSGSGLRLA